MTPNRFQANTRLWAFRYLVLRDGEQCARCHDKPTAKNGNTSRGLDIHHLDLDPFNNDPENLALYCRACNNKARLPRSTAYSATCERERKEGNASTRIAREALNYTAPEAPLTMQANALYEMKFRKWLLQLIQDRGFIRRVDAFNAGAEVVGCSPLTTQRYIAKLTSSAGVLTEVKDLLGEAVLTWRADIKPEEVIKLDLDNLTPEEIRAIIRGKEDNNESNLPARGQTTLFKR